MDPFVTYADVTPSYNVQMLEKAYASASAFMGEKLINFAAFVEPYKNQMAERVVSFGASMGEKIADLSTVIKPYTSSFTHEVTSFVSAHPVLMSTIGIVVVLALTLKIAQIAFKCFDQCFKNKPKQDQQEVEQQNLLSHHNFDWSQCAFTNQGTFTNQAPKTWDLKKMRKEG